MAQGWWLFSLIAVIWRTNSKTQPDCKDAAHIWKYNPMFNRLKIILGEPAATWTDCQCNINITLSFCTGNNFGEDTKKLLSWGETFGTQAISILILTNGSYVKSRLREHVKYSEKIHPEFLLWMLSREVAYFFLRYLFLSIFKISKSTYKASLHFQRGLHGALQRLLLWHFHAACQMLWKVSEFVNSSSTN